VHLSPRRRSPVPRDDRSSARRSCTPVRGKHFLQSTRSARLFPLARARPAYSSSGPYRRLEARSYTERPLLEAPVGKGESKLRTNAGVYCSGTTFAAERGGAAATCPAAGAPRYCSTSSLITLRRNEGKETGVLRPFDHLLGLPAGHAGLGILCRLRH